MKVYEMIELSLTPREWDSFTVSGDIVLVALICKFLISMQINRCLQSNHWKNGPSLFIRYFFIEFRRFCCGNEQKCIHIILWKYFNNVLIKVVKKSLSCFRTYLTNSFRNCWGLRNKSSKLLCPTKRLVTLC